MATLAELLVRIGVDATSFERDMGKVENKIKRLGGRFEDVGKRLTTGLTLPMVGLAAGALKASIDFETAFAGVRKTVDASEQQFAALREGIRAMAKEMPASATEIAAVAEAAGQLGIKTENILDFTRVMIDLGVSTNLSADQAATALARLANITQMPQNQFDRLGATIVALGNNLATTEAEIVEMGLRIAGAGHQVGMTEAQILSLAAALSSVGIEAEAGGSAISRVMITIANQVASGGEKLGLFARVAGMTADQFRQAWQQDAAGALIAFIEGLNRMSASGQNVFAVLEELGLSEIRVRDALLRAAGAGDLFRTSLELGSQAWEENTALTREAGQRYATTESQLQILKNQATDMAITLGDALAPALRDALTAAQPLIDAVQRMAAWFANLSPEMQRVVVTIGGIVALLGPMLIGFGLVVKTISGLVGAVRLAVGAQGLGGLLATGGKLMEAFALWRGGAGTFMEALRLVVNPAGIWIAAIAAIIAIGVLLWTHWDEIKAFLSATWDAISAKATAVWGSLTIWLSSTWESIRSTAAAMWEAVYNAVSGQVNRVKDAITGALTAALDRLKGQASRWLQAGADLIKSLAKGIASIKIPLPTFEIQWATGPLGIQIPKLNIGINWRALGDLIPFLAEGGIVTSPTLAVVGEAGPEAVVPLNPRGLAAAGWAGGVGPITVNVYGSVGVDDIAERLVDEIRRRTGIRI